MTGKRVLLECDHIIVFTSAPVRNEMLWCVRCEKYSRCLGLDLREWAAMCQDCATTRWHGQDKTGAELSARRHAMRKPSHRPFTKYLAPVRASRRANDLGEDVAYG